MKLQTKLTMMLLTLILLLGAVNAALADTEGDFEYEIENGTATITQYTGTATELVIPATLGGKPVTTIGKSAFMECISLTSITIPDSVTSIGSRSFYRCESLTSIVIPDSVTTIESRAFADCFNLTSIVIPDSVTFIGKSAFRNCDRLTTVISSATAAKNYEWEYGVRVGLIDEFFEYVIENGTATITQYTGTATELVIPTTLGGKPVTSIGTNAFFRCRNLTTVTIPESVTSIGGSAFMGCTSLTTINLPDSVTSISNNAFSGCTSLTTVDLPDSVTSIGSNAFSGCTSLTTVNTTCTAAQSYPWPASVRVGMFDDNFSFLPVGDDVYCLMSYSGDASVVLVPSTYNGNPVVMIDRNAFDKSITLFVTGDTSFVASNPCWRYTVNADDTFCLTGTNITDARLLLPSDACGTSITAIGDYAFAGMDMSFVHIPDSIVTVGENPFRDCMALTTIVVNPENAGLHVSADGALYSKADKRLVCFPAGLTASKLTIPEGVRIISAYALYGAQASEIILPNTLTAIGQSAFEENEHLTEITLPDGVTTIAERVFANCPNLTEITFPAALESIGNQAFLGCDGLLRLILPDMVKFIGTEAFAGCIGLQQVSIPASVTHIGKNAFTGAPLLTLYVQPGSYAAAYARENLIHALYPDSDSWLTE